MTRDRLRMGLRLAVSNRDARKRASGPDEHNPDLNPKEKPVNSKEMLLLSFKVSTCRNFYAHTPALGDAPAGQPGRPEPHHDSLGAAPVAVCAAGTKPAAPRAAALSTESRDSDMPGRGPGRPGPGARRQVRPECLGCFGCARVLAPPRARVQGRPGPRTSDHSKSGGDFR